MRICHFQKLVSISAYCALQDFIDDEEPIHAIEEDDQAPIASAGEFLKLPFVTDDGR